MAVTLSVICQTVAEDGTGDVQWTNLTNCTLDDDNETNVDALPISGGDSSFIECTNFALQQIPDGSTIDGFEYRFGEMYHVGVGNPEWKGIFHIDENGTRGTSNQASATTNPTDVQKNVAMPSTGSSTQLWGDTPTPADVKDIDWGVAIQVENTNATFESEVLFDWIGFRVFYTEPNNTGFILPDTAVGNRTVSGGTENWTTPDNIKLTNFLEAVFSYASNGLRSNGLAASNFGFDILIPSQSTINGIQVNVHGMQNLSGGVATWNSLRLILADNSDGTENKASEAVQPRTSVRNHAFVGDVDDLWGETLTRDDVVDPDFGFFISFDGDSGAAATLEIDAMRMQVYFDPPTTANSGWQFPATMVNNRTIAGSDADWSNADNCKADDASNATASLLSAEITSGLAASNFDFSSVPVGADIVGIEVRVGDRRLSSGAGRYEFLNLILADDSDGSENKGANQSWSGTAATDDRGGEFDLWGETFTDTDVKDVDFGFYISTEAVFGSAGFEVDFLQMRVHWVAEAGETASGTPSLTAVTAAGTAEITRNANGTPALTPIEAAGTALIINTSSGAATLTPIEAAGTSAIVTPASGSPELTPIESAGTALVVTQANGTPAITAILPAGTVDLQRNASGAASITAVVASGTASIAALQPLYSNRRRLLGFFYG